MEQLTPRQVQILKCIIEEYLSTADPVGSDALERKYDLGVSPATIRNEMVTLTTTGYLRQPHISAGRVPSPKAMKFYVNQLMEEKKLSVAEEVAAKQQVMDSNDNLDKLMHSTTKALATSTHCLAVALTEDGEIWHSGYANILANPEFYNIDVTYSVLSLLEEAKRIKELFFKYMAWEDPIEIVFGEEIGWKNFEPVGIVASKFNILGNKGSLGVIGPTRINYQSIIPFVRYYSQLLNE